MRPAAMPRRIRRTGIGHLSGVARLA
jgi:hypothetical protein